MPVICRSAAVERSSAQLTDINESTVFGIHGSSSRGLRDPPREFPLYIVCRVSHSAVKHAQSSICSSLQNQLCIAQTALYSDIVALASPKIPPTLVAHFQQKQRWKVAKINTYLSFEYYNLHSNI